MPSNYLILCRPLLLLPQSLPASGSFPMRTLRMRWPKYWSFSFSISPSNEHPGLISFRMDYLDLLAVQGTLKSLLQHWNSQKHWSGVPTGKIPGNVSTPWVRFQIAVRGSLVSNTKLQTDNNNLHASVQPYFLPTVLFVSPYMSRFFRLQGTGRFPRLKNSMTHLFLLSWVHQAT